MTLPMLTRKPATGEDLRGTDLASSIDAVRDSHSEGTRLAFVLRPRGLCSEPVARVPTADIFDACYREREHCECR
jgi:hypothetical protein